MHPRNPAWNAPVQQKRTPDPLGLRHDEPVGRQQFPEPTGCDSASPPKQRPRNIDELGNEDRRDQESELTVGDRRKIDKAGSCSGWLGPTSRAMNRFVSA